MTQSGTRAASDPAAPSPLLAEADAAADADMAALVAHPVAVVEPAVRKGPVIFSVPHSGRIYPHGFARQSRLDATTLRKSEDAFVDELFEAVPALGAPLVIARFPRACVDVNRAPGEIDAAMFDGALPMAVGPRTARVSAGLGVIPRVVREGVEIYSRRLGAAEAAFRMKAFYQPYHAALAREVAKTVAAYGAALVVDCHSMPAGGRSVEVVLGDRYGESASSQLIALAQGELEGLGFRVARNAPYAGGYTTTQYGRPADGVHALQIEINRALYLDEARVEKHDGFARCRDRLARFAASLIALDPVLSSPETARSRESA